MAEGEAAVGVSIEWKSEVFRESEVFFIYYVFMFVNPVLLSLINAYHLSCKSDKR